MSVVGDLNGSRRSLIDNKRGRRLLKIPVASALLICRWPYNFIDLAD